MKGKLNSNIKVEGSGEMKRFLEYQNAVIGTVQTTLNAGTVFVTLFPNFNMSLRDPHLCDALKVQVQITRASKMVLQLRHFKKMESLAMKASHLLVTYSGMFAIVLIAKKKKLLKKTTQKERKNLLSRCSKKDMKQEIPKLTSLEHPLENLIIMFSILEPENKKSLLFHVRRTKFKILNLH
ncbi:hypothetical protein SO802_019147 [Lithocarpus litseifolius]|uniref:Uncharacterized protein n=1 Tax=Lithocarpus litseifolius TaxID=425828 RepID=A0AAW2CS34_9ROSI